MIEEAIKAAACIVVVWSKDSVQSRWVKNEAAEGAKRDILVPVLIDEVEPPFEFRRVQAAKLLRLADATQDGPEFATSSPRCRTSSREPTAVGRPRVRPGQIMHAAAEERDTGSEEGGFGRSAAERTAKKGWPIDLGRRRRLAFGLGGLLVAPPPPSWSTSSGRPPAAPPLRPSVAA